MDSEGTGISHPKFRMRLRPDGIVQLVWGPAVSMSLEDAVAAIEAMTSITGGRPACLLVDIHDAGPIERLARLEFVKGADLVVAVALVVGTPMSRMMGNLYLSVSRPTAPTRLFDDEASAVDWLRAMPRMNGPLASDH